MTLSDTDTAQLWETFRAGGGAELVRGAVRLVLQELIEAEVTEAIGAGRYERSDARVNERNGHRPRLLATQAGDVELRIPKLRKGSLLPSVLEPRRRIDRALHAVIMEAYVAGVSTRSVDDLVAALGAESGISKSEVSRICAGLDEMVEAFRSRRPRPCRVPLRLCGRDLPQGAQQRLTGRLDGDGRGHRRHHRRQPRDPGMRHRRQRERGVLAELLGLAASPRAHRGAPGDSRRPRRARRRRGPHHPGRRAPSDAGCTSSATCSLWCPAPTSTWPPQCSAPSSRSPDPEAVDAAWDEVAAPARRPIPQSRSADGRRQARGAGLRRVPSGALAEDLVHQPPRTHQQRDQTPITRRGDLPQPSLRHPPRRRHPRRPPRRMASHRAPLPLRALHGHPQPPSAIPSPQPSSHPATNTEAQPQSPPLHGTPPLLAFPLPRPSQRPAHASRRTPARDAR